MKIEDLLFMDNYSKTWEFKRIKSKVRFYNNCGILTKILYGLIYGGDFIPTMNERKIMEYYKEYLEDSRTKSIPIDRQMERR